MMNWVVRYIKSLASFPVLEEPGHANNNYVLNVYVYHYQLVGVIEDTNYKQLFEMKIFTPAEYITWRFSVCWRSPLLNVYGRPFKQQYYLSCLHEVNDNTGYPLLKTQPYRRTY